MSWQFESLKERENLENSTNYELRTLGTARGKQNLEQFLFQVLKIQNLEEFMFSKSRTWKSCWQYLRPSNSKKTPSSKGRKHWAQTKHLVSVVLPTI